MTRITTGSSFSTMLLALLIGSVGLFGLAGCDALAGAAGVDEVDVDLEDAGDRIPIASTNPTARTTQVDRGGQDLPDVFDVESITISEDKVSYDPLLAEKRESADGGTIDAFLIIDRLPAVGARIGIQDDVVTEIDPEVITVGEYGATRFDSCLERLEAEERPQLASGYANLSSEEIQESVGDALKQAQFEVSVMVCSEGNISGFLTIEDVTINLDF